MVRSRSWEILASPPPCAAGKSRVLKGTLGPPVDWVQAAPRESRLLDPPAEISVHFRKVCGQGFNAMFPAMRRRRGGGC